VVEQLRHSQRGATVTTKRPKARIFLWGWLEALVLDQSAVSRDTPHDEPELAMTVCSVQRVLLTTGSSLVM